jgi:dihydroflavonol-4-reductase
MSAYVRSKAIAERAAWDFMEAEGGRLELAAVNPTGIFGPALGPAVSSSIELITRLMKGMPGCPRLFFGIVDVRDVADLHLRAMTHPAAKSERFIASSGDPMSMLDVARVLRAHLGDAASKVPTRELPNWLVPSPHASTEPFGRSSRSSTAREQLQTQRRSVCSAGSRARLRRPSSQLPEA